MSWCACSATITASHPTRLRAAASAPKHTAVAQRHVHARHIQVPALGGLASCALCAAVSPGEVDVTLREQGTSEASVGPLSPEPRPSGSLYGSGIGPDLARAAADAERAQPPTPLRSLARRSSGAALELGRLWGWGWGYLLCGWGLGLGKGTGDGARVGS